ncbi:MAG: nucleotidyltransferase substrate binding protein [Chloroflexi bacterium]|nr:nucleotidyltransferase substrate binding protein [Chloroflexota bacterium]
MRLNTEYLDRIVQTLDSAFALLRQQEPGSIAYEIYRAACVKEFELAEEQCGNLLKKRISGYFASNRDVDELFFKDIFRHAAKHALIAGEACERWLTYRDIRNRSAHQYGEQYARDVLDALPAFITDAQSLSLVIGEETP